MNINTPEYWEKQFEKEERGEFMRFCFERFEYLAIHLDNKGKTLDVGCGLGNFSRYLKAREPKMDIIGVEFSRKIVEKARKLAPYLKFEYWDGKHLPFDSYSFSNVVASEVIEHLEETKLPMFIKELCRVTKKDGRIVLSTPYRGLAEKCNEHIKEYTPDELALLLQPFAKGKIRLALPPIKIDPFDYNKIIRSHYFIIMFHPWKDMPVVMREVKYG